jgi:prevent-host-death family protein
MVMPEVVGVREAKAGISQLLGKVQEGQTYEIVKYGKPIAILMGVENYKMLLERVEDLEDILDAKEAMKEPSRSFEKFASEYEARHKAGV